MSVEELYNRKDTELSNAKNHHRDLFSEEIYFLNLRKIKKIRSYCSYYLTKNLLWLSKISFINLDRTPWTSGEKNNKNNEKM